MSHWNYRMTVERDANGNDFYAIREIYYDNRGRPNGWGPPASFAGDAWMEVVDSMSRASSSISFGVIDLDTRREWRFWRDRVKAMKNSSRETS